MNNASGSALQKVSFVLLLIIAAALGYLIVRQLILADRQHVETVTTAPNPPATNAQLERIAPPLPSKVAYAPLRPRIETNIVRVGSNRVVGVPFPGPSQTIVVDRIQPEVTLRGIPTVVAGGAPMGGRVVTGRGGQSVSGRVLIRGTPPPEKSTQPDAVCGRLHPAPMTTRHYVVGQDGGLADVFVYVKEGAEAQRVAKSATTPLLDQINCEFQPYITGVQVGQKFIVQNSDAVMHNVHLMPLVGGNRARNLTQPTRGFKSEFTFEKPEVFIQIKCDVHPWMFAYIGVVEHPWFAVTDKKGNFTLPADLPPGDYALAAVHRKLGEAIQQINVNTDGVVPVTFTLDVPEELVKNEKP